MLLSLLSLMLIPSRAEAVAVPFGEIPRIVMENNQHAQGAAYLRKSAEAGKGVLGRSFLPALEARGGAEAFKTGSQRQREEPFGFLEARWNVFHGGRNQLEGRIADARSYAVSAEADLTLREEIRKARQGYWNLVALRELVGILEEAVSENRKNQGAAGTRIRAGIATETDRIEFEMHAAELAQELARFRLSAENTERSLAILLGLAEGTPIETPLSVGHEHSDSLLKVPYKEQEHPEVHSVLLRSLEADLESEKLRRWWTPSVDVFGSYGLHTFREREFDARAERMESVVGVQLSVQLFDGFNGRAETQRKALEAEGLRREHIQASRELKARVEGAKAELKLTHQLIHESEETLKRSRAYLTRTLDEYRRGVKNSPDVLSASERNFSVRRRFVELRRDYQLARAELMSILGE